MASTGVIKTYGLHKRFGFIVSDEAEGDIYFQDRDLPPQFQHVDPNVFPLEGCTVTFQLHTGKDGKPQARGVQFVSAAGEEGSAVLFGEVKSFSTQKGFGFLTCPQVEGDVYFQNRDVPPTLRGQYLQGFAVAFELREATDGKPQARNLRFLGGGADAGGFMAEAQAAASMMMPAMQQMLVPRQSMFAQSGGKGMVGKGGTMRMMSMAQGMPMLTPRASMGMLMPSAGAPRALKPMRGPGMGRFMPPMDGESAAGVIKTYEAAKGWGFISHPNVPVDIYFKAQGAMEPGQQVAFTMRWMPDGRPQAWDVSVGVEDGSTVVGVIKSISDKNGYGFISCDDVGQDIYFKKSLMSPAMQAKSSEELSGIRVRCVIKYQPDGKPTATEVSAAGGAAQGLKRLTAGSSTGSEGKLVPAAKRARVEVAPKVEGEEGVGGVIKSYNPTKGWGFISSPSAAGDVYFKQSSLPRGVEAVVGTEIGFTLQYTADGKAQATHIQVLG